METSAPLAKSTPYQVFLHLMMMAMLYVSVISVITLLVQYIDLSFPDELIRYGGTYDGIRYSSSALIVAFPVFLLTSWMIRKAFKVHPEQRNIAIRKWLIYLTLFVAGITIVIDLIQFVNRFYSGELTVPFLLKVLVVLLVTAATFGYFLWDLRERGIPQARAKMLASGVSVLLLVVLGTGFVLAGSPGDQRNVRLDEERVGHLQSIQYEVTEYWRGKGKLPEQLSDLERDIYYFELPSDPETGESYEYRVKGALAFEVCATFSTKSENGMPNRYPAVGVSGTEGEQWKHKAGFVCFERTIDPDFVKPYEEVK